MRKPDAPLQKQRHMDQLLCSNCTADQRLCFRYTDSTIPLGLNPKSIFCDGTESCCKGNRCKPRRLVFLHSGSFDVLTILAFGMCRDRDEL